MISYHLEASYNETESKNGMKVFPGACCWRPGSDGERADEDKKEVDKLFDEVVASIGPGLRPGDALASCLVLAQDLGTAACAGRIMPRW